MKLKKFYFVVTSEQRWGRGIELKEALKNAGVKTLPSKNTQVALYIGIVREEATDAEVANLNACWVVNDMGGLSHYLNLTPEDSAMIDRLFLGWIVDNSFVEIPKTSKKHA